MTTRLLCAVAILMSAVAAEEVFPPPEYNVRDFGAVGDGDADDTPAFARALAAAEAAGGGIVFAPRGNYYIAGPLRIGPYVTLRGIQTVPYAWSENKGTTLLTDWGEGEEEADAFITMHGSCMCLQGVTIYYPKQDPEAEEPTPYPWTVDLAHGDNASIVDCLFVNPYKAVDFTWAGRHYIRGLYGRPIKIGILVDNCLDVGRIENVHFWPFWAGWGRDKPISKWIFDNGVAFQFARTDWEYVADTFCFGYKIGYQFFEGERGSCNGNFLGIGADVCRQSVRVDECQRIGLLITNGEFVSNFEDGYGVYVAETNTGRVNFSNCAFWANTGAAGEIFGTGNVTFSSCNFINWGDGEGEDWAIVQHGGSMIVQGCHFADAKPDVMITQGAEAAVVMGNVGADGVRVANSIGGRAQVGLNAPK